MGYMIAFEMEKLWRKKGFLVLLCAVMMIKTACMFYESQNNEIPNRAYKAFDTRLKNLSETEKENYVRQWAEKTEAIYLIENVNLLYKNGGKENVKMAKALKNQNRRLYQKYYEQWNKKDYILFTGDIFLEQQFAIEMKSRIIGMKYDTFLNSVLKDEQNNQEISIFKDNNKETGKDAFSEQVVHMSAEKYKKMRGVLPQRYSYQWIKSFTAGEITELLLLIFLCVIIYQMIYEEKRKGLFSIIRATASGKVKCAVSKITVLFINIAILMFLLYGIIFFYSVTTIGVFGLNAPIQSVSEFVTCPYRLTVWQFMLLALVVKWMTLFFVGLLLLAAALAVSNAVITFLLVGGLLGGEWFFYHFITGASGWNLFHYLNVWQFLKSEQVIGNYVLLNIFGKPESVCVMMIFFISSGIIIGSMAGTWIFAKRTAALPEIAKKDSSRIGYRGRIYKHIWGYESYKILIMNPGIILMAIFVVVMFATGKNTNCYLTTGEEYYRQWMQNLSGNLTEKKENEILGQKAYYEDVLKKIENLNVEYRENKINEETFESQEMILKNQLVFYPVFQRVYERYKFVRKEKDRKFVYEEGYNKLIGKKDQMYLGMWTFIGFILILFLSPVFTMDKEKGMEKVLQATLKGRKNVVRNKMLVSLVCVFLMHLCFFIRNVYIAQANYGMNQLFTSVSNLHGFENLPEWMTILTFIIGIFLLQVFCVFLASILILFVSGKIGNTIHSIVWESIILFVVAAVCYHT